MLFSVSVAYAQNSQSEQKDAAMLKSIYDEMLTHGKAYEDLRYLCKNIGSRVSGSPQAAAAVAWGQQLMESYDFDTVFLQEVMVPHWVRGAKEQAHVIDPTMGKVAMNITALGNAVGTGDEGVFAEVIEVKSLDTLAVLGKNKLSGKIIFFNRPMDQTQIQTGHAYGMAGDQRRSGPAEAARYGAKGVVVRTLSTAFDDFPHTGSTVYTEGVKKIPAVAISTNDADRLSEMLKRNRNLKFYFETHCQMLPEVLSYNVVGQLNGTEKPDEYIILGGHLDSWDLAEGAHDDGTGVVQAIEALRTFKALGYRPKHSIRAVLFMNEENGLAGGKEYAVLASKNNEKHIAAIESDGGGFTPRGFRLDVNDAALKQIQRWSPLFQPYDIHKFEAGESGSDVEPLKDQQVNLIGLSVDSQRYFDIHHSALDVFEIVNRRELLLGSAAMASLIYLIDQYGLESNTAGTR